MGLGIGMEFIGQRQACIVVGAIQRAAIEAYNLMAERAGLPQCQKVSKARQAAIRARLNDAGGLEGWQAALEKVEASDFLTGGGNRGWRADIDFIASDRGFTRIMEGAHDGKPNTGRPKGIMETSMEFLCDYETKGAQSDVDAVADAIRRRGGQL